ncbi:hypothetical protein LIER_12298 [Lithospermum erythrorhizon]|uniref:CUE domain-containing protein n=1 Tax=Lithospermum erythrorhizon TaxID=34254 RepID=A0AAV3PU92_LITER
MKSSKFTLNPNAESYVPLCNREVVGETKDFKPGESESGKNAAWSPQHDMYNAPSVDTLMSADSTKLKSQSDYGDYSSPSQHVYGFSEKQPFDEEFDMDMTFLQMSFPGISEESLSGVYAVNNRNMDATIDMLNELEVQADFSAKLPDSLDIGDVSEPGYSTESASKLKKVDEVGPSSSGST